jgi:hypothetical protein
MRFDTVWWRHWLARWIRVPGLVRAGDAPTHRASDRSHAMIFSFFLASLRPRCGVMIRWSLVSACKRATRDRRSISSQTMLCSIARSQSFRAAACRCGDGMGRVLDCSTPCWGRTVENPSTDAGRVQAIRAAWVPWKDERVDIMNGSWLSALGKGSAITS